MSSSTNNADSSNSAQQFNKAAGGNLETSVWRTLGRLLHEFIYIVFFVGLHWLIKWGLKRTNQEQEWWAAYLLYVSILFAVIAFTIIFGAELIVDCWRAIRFAKKHLTEK